jgi:tetratricopeptide (TPR) repeat protein
LALCVFISQLAIEAESKIVRAVKLALTITASKQPNSPRWDEPKAEMLKLLREGVAINPHYRKLTPMVADEMARWGDWTNATWIWESVAQSRPYVVAIMSNVARGYSLAGNMDKAFHYLERCKKLQPDAPSVRSLEVILLARTGRQPEAMALIRQAFADQVVDYDMAQAAISLGFERKDWDLALTGLALRAKNWPATAVDAWLRTGKIYADAQLAQHDEAKALAAFRQALALAKPTDLAAVRADIPLPYQQRL